MKTLTKVKALEIAKDTWRIISEHDLRSKSQIKDVNVELYERINPMLHRCSLCQFVIEQAGIVDNPFELNSDLCSEHCPCYEDLHCLDDDDSYEEGESSDFEIWRNLDSDDEEVSKAANNIFDIIKEAYELELSKE